MSVDNGKVCCICRHLKRVKSDDRNECRCEIDDHYIGYINYFEGWCQHWARGKQNESNTCD